MGPPVKMPLTCAAVPGSLHRLGVDSSKPEDLLGHGNKAA